MFHSTRIASVLLSALVLALVAAPSQAAGVLESLFPQITCDGDASDAGCRIDIAPGIALEGPRNRIEVREDQRGVRLTQEIVLPTAAGELRLQEADLTIVFGDDPVFGRFETLRGTARVPFPALGVLQSDDVVAGESPRADIGLDRGANLAGLGIPVPRAERLYWFFDLFAGYSVEIGSLVIETPSVGAAFILDPLDPYFYIEGSGVPFPGNDGGISGGFGFSLHDEIPFEPVSTWGMEDEILGFAGSYIEKVSGPIGKLPVVVRGEKVFSLDPEKDGDHPILSPLAFLEDPDLAYGVNGEFGFEWYPFASKQPSRKKQKKLERRAEKQSSEKTARKAKKNEKAEKKAAKKGVEPKKKFSIGDMISIQFDLGQASGTVLTSSDFANGDLYLRAALSGEVATSTSDIVPPFLPLPIAANGALRVASIMSSDPLESFLRAEGEFALDTRPLAGLVGLELAPVDAKEGELRIDRHGFLLRGSSDSQLHGSVSPRQTQEVEAFIAPDGLSSHLTLRGGMTIAGEGLRDAELVLSPLGLAAGGVLDLDEHSFAMSAEFKRSKTVLEGSADVSFPFEKRDTAQLLELLDQIANQEEVVKAAEIAFDAASDALAVELAVQQPIIDSFEAARAEFESWDAALRKIDGDINGLESLLAGQRSRSCSKSYSGCKSCSSCSSRCDCGKLDLICKSDCGVCNAARGICLGEREACAEGKRVACVADRDSKIVAYESAILEKRGERVAVAAGQKAALAVVNELRAGYEAASAALAAVRATFEAAEAGYELARAKLGDLRRALDLLPIERGTIDAVVTLRVISEVGGTPRKLGKVEASFDGQKIADGWVDFDSSPRRACIEVPVPGFPEELCTVL